MNRFFYATHLWLLLCLISLTTLTAQGQSGWNKPASIDALIENHPDLHRRVYYLFDRNSGTEYNRIQVSGSRNKLTPTEVQNIRKYYDDLYSEVADGIRNGARHSLSQFITADSVSYTIDAPLSGMLDIGPSTIEIDLGNRQSATEAAKQPDFRNLEKAIDSFISRPGVTTAKVKYTGFKRGYVFVFHRGTGKGWTSGTRYTLRNASRNDFEALRKCITSFIGSKVPVTVYDCTDLTMLKNENGPQFYAVGYDPRTRTLNVLKATVENEICIPDLWQTLDYISD